MGILICGLNGTGKSTLGRLLADRMGYEFIDNEDLFFPRTDPSYTFSGPRSKEEVIRLLEERISRNNRFIFAAVKGDYGDRLIASLECIVLIEVPKQIRSKRVRDRSYQKFGDRILPGGDLYDQESKWFSLTDSRPETYVTDWLETVHCSVVRIDGTRPVEENADDLMPVLSKGTNDERGSEEDCGHISCAEDEKMLDYRLMTIEDYEAAYDLWIRCGNGLNDKDDSREGIEKYLKRNPDTSYVAVLDGKVVGVILCGHDGRRGIIQHACVSPDCRRMGIGKKLVDLALDALKKEGINKVLLVAFKKNEGGNAFWESQGFTLREDLNYRNKALAEMVRIDPDYLKG